MLEDWESSDSTTYVLKLRSGVKFHDGTDYNADVLKFNLERVADPKTGGLNRSDMAGIAEIEVVDSYTARVRLKAPDGSFIAKLADSGGFTISPSALEKSGDEFGRSQPVGSGAFEFVEWVAGDHLTAKRYADYWQKDEFGESLPYLDQIIFRPITDMTSALTTLRAGDLDMIEQVLPSDLAKVKEDPNLTYDEGIGGRQYVWLNNAKPPFDNKALRQAVSWAIDRDSIHRSIYFGTGSPGRYMLPPGNWALEPNGNFYGHDLAMAKQKLAEAGYPNGLKFTYLYSNNTTEALVAQAIKAQLAEVGLEAQLVPLESNVNAARRNSGDFEASGSRGSQHPDPDISIYKFLRSGESINRSQYSNPKVDELLDKARALGSQADRKPLYQQAQALILDDAPLVYIHQDADLKVRHKRVKGYVPPGDTFLRDYQRMWLDPEAK